MRVIIASSEESKLEKNYFREKSDPPVEYFTILGKYKELFWLTITTGKSYYCDFVHRLCDLDSLETLMSTRSNLILRYVFLRGFGVIKVSFSKLVSCFCEIAYSSY